MAKKLLPRKRQERSISLNQLKTLVIGGPTLSGVAVNEQIAIGISAVKRAITLISGKIASLDACVYRQTTNKGRLQQYNHPVELLLKYPNDYINAEKFWRTFFTSLCSYGNAVAEIERSTDDKGIGLHFIPWNNVDIRTREDGTFFYHLMREGKNLEARDVVHVTYGISWDGIQAVSPIRAARETLGISIAAERHAGSVYGNGAVPRGILKTKAKLTPEVKSNIREAWNTLHQGVENGNNIAIFGPDLEWLETNMTPEDAQLLQSRAFQIEEVARIFGVPVHLLFSGNQQSYNANEEQNQQFYQLSLQPILENLEAEIDFKLLTQQERLRGIFVKYNVTELNRGNFKNTVDSWSRLVLTGIATQNEAREALGKNPIEGGDKLYMPLNMSVSQDKDGNDVLAFQPPTPSPSLNPPEENTRGEQLALPGPSPALQGSIRGILAGELARALRRQEKNGFEREYIEKAIPASFSAWTLSIGSEKTFSDFVNYWETLDNPTIEDLVQWTEN
jgi:HK97 family phage portal protein